MSISTTRFPEGSVSPDNCKLHQLPQCAVPYTTHSFLSYYTYCTNGVLRAVNSGIFLNPPPYALASL